jgi:thymidylate synthase (FAD)
MKIVKPGYQIITYVNAYETLLNVMRAGRTCYKSEGDEGPIAVSEFSKMIINRGHLSVIEHESVSVRIVCDRGVSHELVRHRLASYSQESTRYCNYSGGVTFIKPPWCDFPVGKYDNNRVHNMYEDLPDIGPQDEWLCSMLQAEEYYLRLLKLGWTPQQARSVLPNSLKTEVVMTANLREWRHVFKLRTEKAAHPQMREVMIPMLAEFKEKIPVIFDDIKPE